MPGMDGTGPDGNFRNCRRRPFNRNLSRSRNRWGMEERLRLLEDELQELKNERNKEFKK